jgi:hypothetical protein
MECSPRAGQACAVHAGRLRRKADARAELTVTSCASGVPWADLPSALAQAQAQAQAQLHPQPQPTSAIPAKPLFRLAAGRQAYSWEAALWGMLIRGNL